MYTGVIEETGRIATIDRLERGCELTVEADTEGTSVGDSVAVSGVCLTATEVYDGWFACECSPETVERTYLADCDPGDAVNVERPLSADGRFHGHVVKGTVDATTTVAGVEETADGWRYEAAIPEGYGPYVVEKGAVALDGISLTVDAVEDGTFEVAVVPITRDLTTLSEKAAGDPLHFEADVLAKYARADRAAVEG